MSCFYGVVRFESVDMNSFTYLVCTACGRKPGSNYNCQVCRNGAAGQQQSTATSSIRPAYALRATISAGNGLYKVVLFDSAATKLLGYSAERIEHFIEQTLLLRQEREERGEDVEKLHTRKRSRSSEFSSVLPKQAGMEGIHHFEKEDNNKKNNNDDKFKVVDGRDFIASNIRGTVVLCELQEPRNQGTDLHMKLHSVISKPPPRQGLSVLEDYNAKQKRFKTIS